MLKLRQMSTTDEGHLSRSNRTVTAHADGMKQYFINLIENNINLKA
jgi:hypothetical protein